MEPRQDHDAILTVIEGLGIFQSPHRTVDPKFGDSSVLEGTLTVSGVDVTVQLVLDRFFPTHLPRFFLTPWDALGFIPHVNPDGQICFLDPEGLVLDCHRPVAIVEDAFQRVRRTLLDGVSGRNRADFSDEWEVYWGQLDNVAVAFSATDPRASEVGRVVIMSRSNESIWVADDENEIKSFYNGTDLAQDLTRQYGLYVPLEPGSMPVPPRPDRPFWTVEEIRQMIFDNLSDANRAKLHQLTKRRARRTEYVILCLPRPSGGATLFGIRFDDVRGAHPLRPRGTARQSFPLVFQRCDRDYLIARGGGDVALDSKRVLLVGVGAVGGHLALELARAGVTNFAVIDGDTFVPENSFRHALGRKHWFKPKAQAMKDEIESLLPFVRVTPIVDTIENALEIGVIELSNYDLVIMATGNPTIELEINRLLHRLQKRPPAIFTWLEPLGIGGHALVTGNTADEGCLECLFTAVDDSQQPLVNRAAFAAPGQSFGRALSGCGSLHTPFGSLDAVQTANMAARLAIQVLTREERGNPLLAWKGDAAAFESAGFRLSARYATPPDELARHRYSYRNVRCPVCGDLENAGER